MRWPAQQRRFTLHSHDLRPDGCGTVVSGTLMGVLPDPATTFPAPFWLFPAGNGQVDDLLFQVAFDLHPYRSGLVRLAFRGDLDEAAVPELAAGLSMLFGCLPHAPAVSQPLAYLDLSELTFLDSAGNAASSSAIGGWSASSATSCSGWSCDRRPDGLVGGRLAPDEPQARGSALGLQRALGVDRR
jgi:hypothetical protein